LKFNYRNTGEKRWWSKKRSPPSPAKKTKKRRRIKRRKNCWAMYTPTIASSKSGKARQLLKGKENIAGGAPRYQQKRECWV